MPIPQKCSPHLELVEEHNARWTAHMVAETGHGSVAWFRATNCVEFACWLYPDADAQVACFVSDFCSWLFSVDDHHPHESNPDMHQVMDLVGECLGVMGGAPPRTGISRLQRELMDRFQDMVHPSQYQGFVSTTSTYIASLGLHAAIQHSALRLDPRTYWPIRLHDSAAMTLLALCQAGVPELRRAPDLLSVPEYATLARTAGKIIATSNDVLSYPRERASETNGRNYLFNSVTLREQQGMSVQSALDHVAEEFSDDVATFQEECRRLRDSCIPGSELYVDALAYWTSGIDRWQKETDRYTELW